VLRLLYIQWCVLLIEEIRLQIFRYRVFTIPHYNQGTPVYTRENLLEILATPVKTCFKGTGTPVKICWIFDSSNCFQSGLLCLWPSTAKIKDRNDTKIEMKWCCIPLQRSILQHGFMGRAAVRGSSPTPHKITWKKQKNKRTVAALAFVFGYRRVHTGLYRKW